MCENLLPPDPVALVMTIEEKFGISIPDGEAGKICTMGQLYDYVHSRIARGQPQVCVTSAAFYRLRRALGEVCAVPRERVRLEARLDDLIPLADRPRCWQELRTRLGNLHLPCLCPPEWLVNLIQAASGVPFAVALLGFVSPVFVLSPTPAAVFLFFFGIFISWFLGIVGGMLVWRIGCHHAEHYPGQLPASCTTVRILVYTLVSRPPAAPWVSDTARASDKEIWGTLCALVGSHFDCPQDSFTRASSFSSD